ncbi:MULTISPECIES: cell division activator CedA [Lelliottia]|uniref:Cell division activator CedA n=1 Tax=Lelliottia aquatilis TaxID=2080838 RepID=A0ABX5A410_9ENTR|nr:MULTISPECIES: cell division activator CedA [Lelliottia]NTZ47888.1 cell division activator CedA [Lelliottia aquatilis]POZ24172.1 cell division activator CedA [Lelliottia aquatilis]POZ27427.1 cell division activator CedA [Lelliottia sp. 7254-16]POZ29697.1 cell division activator CedA [Lelliottia aquatilis]POZ35263.1 cell division activator CedA [Lelliottia aquatilis]
MRYTDRQTESFRGVCLRECRTQGATRRGGIGYDWFFLFPEFALVNQSLMKSFRQQNRRVISYVPRVEPAPPDHALKVDGFRDVWQLRGKYVAFVLMGEHFRRSPTFTVPEAAQRWAAQIRQEDDIQE